MSADRPEEDDLNCKQHCRLESGGTGQTASPALPHGICEQLGYNLIVTRQLTGSSREGDQLARIIRDS
jgi:hypothetical protein